MYYTDLDKDEIAEEFRLCKFDKIAFVGNKYYGGDQKWLSEYNYTSKFWSDRSCGVTAAANVIHYITNSRNEGKLSFSVPEYTELMAELYTYIKPTVFGVPTIRKIKSGFKAFAKVYKLETDSCKYKGKWDVEQVWEYIKKAIEYDCPVFMITWNTKIRNLKNHWVTITGIIKTKSGKRYIITSNWGKMELFDLEQWVISFSLNKGLLYFKRPENKILRTINEKGVQITRNNVKIPIEEKSIPQEGT